MINFNDIFKNEYQYTLKEIEYRVVKDDESDGAKLNVVDNISCDKKDNKLFVTFERKVFFCPTSIYHLKVAYGIIVTFNDEYEQDISDIDWCKEFADSDNVYMHNVISRASGLIASITSSYGQPPLITPPRYIPKNS